MELRGDTFFFNLDNAALARTGGEPAPARLDEALIWTSMGALLLIPSLSVPIVLAGWFSVPLWILALLTAAVSATVALGVVSARWAWAAWASALSYRREGRLVYGRLLRSDAAADEEGCPVTLDFTFTDPDGLEVCGRACRRRPDLLGHLPPRNTPVALLYVSREQYELL